MLPLLYKTTSRTISIDSMEYIGRITDCQSCLVTEVLNGDYLLTAEVKNSDSLYNKITVQEFICIKANTIDAPQFFEIYEVVKNISGSMFIKAKHIKHCAYNNIMTAGLNNSTLMTPSEIWVAASDSPVFENNFIFESDITNRSSVFEVGFSRVGTFGEFFEELTEKFDGELYWNNFNVKFLKSRGSKKHYTLRFGQNISSLEQTLSTEDIKSHIIAFAIPVMPYKITANKDYVFSTQPDRNNKPDSAISTTNPTVSLMKDSTVIVSTIVKGSWEDNSKSINSNVDTEVNKIQITIATGKQVNINFHIQLEAGTEYTKYTSPTNKSLSIPLGNNSVKTDNIENNAVTFDKLSDDVKRSINNDYKMNYLYVDLNYTETDDGFGITKFNSIIEANNSIKDNSKTNRYTILIYPGTYTELQNLYSGITDTANLQGIKTKDYVYYEGTQPYNPQSTCIEWDGAFGYDEGALTSETAVKKCIFHLTSGLNGMHTHIKNLHLKSKNTRYGLHIETGGYGRNVEWQFSNCIVEFGGRPDINGDRNAPCCGMGVSPYERGEFSSCQFVFTDKEGITPDLVILNCHNNAETTVYTEVRPIKEGSRIIFNSCDFNGYSVKFATTYEQNGTKNIAEFNGCSNYSNITTLPSATYGDNWDVIDSMKDLNYELTDSDKLEIANLVLSQIPTTNGVEY